MSLVDILFERYLEITNCYIVNNIVMICIERWLPLGLNTI